MNIQRVLSIIATITVLVLMATGCQSGQQQKTEPIAGVESTQQQTQEPQLKQQTQEQKKDDEVRNEPRIVVTKSGHNLKQIGPGSTHKASYDFVNEGTGTLSVKNIQSTCGCSRPTLIKGDKRYPMPLKDPVPFEPGQSGQVEVTYKAGMTKGKVTKHLYIISDDPEKTRAQLSITAEVVVKVEVTPERIELRLDKENAGIPDLVVKSIDGQPFSIRSVTVGNKVITVPFDPEQESTEFTLKPQVDTEKLSLSQFSTGVIQIRTTHPQAGNLLVRYKAKPMFEVSNPRYILQNVEPGKSVLRENLIRSNYGEKAEIESYSSRNGYMEIVGQEEDGNHLKLSVEITPPARTSSRRYITDELNITLKGGHKLSVRCSGWFRLK